MIMVSRRTQGIAQGDPDECWVEVQYDRCDKGTRDAVAEFAELLNCLRRVRAEVLSGGVLRLVFEPSPTES